MSEQSIPHIIELADGTKCVRLEDFLRERDKARNDIIGWENKWKCAVDMAARAELERDEARDAILCWENKWKCAVDMATRAGMLQAII